MAIIGQANADANGVPYSIANPRPTGIAQYIQPAPQFNQVQPAPQSNPVQPAPQFNPLPSGVGKPILQLMGSAGATASPISPIPLASNPAVNPYINNGLNAQIANANRMFNAPIQRQAPQNAPLPMQYRFNPMIRR